MPQMPATFAAGNFCALHAQALVGGVGDVLFYRCFIKAFPAASTLKLGSGMEQHGAAAYADIIAFFKKIPVLTRKGSLCAFFAAHMVLQIAEFASPFFVIRIFFCRLTRSRQRKQECYNKQHAFSKLLVCCLDSVCCEWPAHVSTKVL